MSKGVTKTVLEKQINVYNQFQYQIRQMDRLGISRKLPVTVEEQIARSIEIAKEDKARFDKEKAIADFRKTAPQYGSLKGLTTDEVKEISRIKMEWNERYHRFLKTLK